jgi:hypothetical protein
MRHPARFKYLAAGRRWRKTTLAMITAVMAALDGRTVFWGSNTYDQSRIGMAETRKATGAVAQFNQTRMEALFPTGGKIVFRSLDNPDNARGHTADGIVIDEASLVVPEAWYEVLRPVISDTGGWALFIGTPKGRNWFWRESMAAADHADTAAWQIPTLGVEIRDGRLYRKPHPLENPDFLFAEAEAMFRSMPERTFRQEFMAEFIEDAGLVFRNVREVSRLRPGSLSANHAYVMGVDWARSYDWTVLSIIDATARQQVAIDRFNRIDYQFQLERLKAQAEMWRPGVIVAEANAMGTPLIEQLQRDGLPVIAFTTTAQSKAQIIEGLALAIERGDVALLNNETQIAELEAYDMVRLPGGMFRYSAPQGMHDDTVMALALAWAGANEPAAPPEGIYVYDERVTISPF